MSDQEQAILEKADADVEKLKVTAEADMSSQQDRAIAELRQRVTALALADVERQLDQGVDDATQQRLIERTRKLPSMEVKWFIIHELCTSFPTIDFQRFSLVHNSGSQFQWI